MQIFLLIVGIVLFIFLLILRKSARKPAADSHPEQNTSRPPADFKPSAKVENDKLVIVSGVTYDDLKRAVQQSCNLNNQTDYAVLPLLTRVTENDFAITFPYDVNFEIFCYFINYLKYPNDIFYKPTIAAWLTTKRGDEWITDLSENKKVMLFIPEDDDEYDNVFLTTSDNVGYKLGFALGYERQLLDVPKMNFIEPHIEIASLERFQSEQLR